MRLFVVILTLLVASCTQVSVEYTRTDGSTVKADYFSTKSQIAPEFVLDKGSDTVHINAGAKQTEGVDREAVAKMLSTVSQVIFPPPAIP